LHAGATMPGSGMIQLHQETSGDAATPAGTGKTSPDLPAKAQINSSPAKFIRGTLTNVDCSTPPLATLTVVSGARTWKMKVADSNHLILIGADQFSCAWAKQKVAVNYRETSEGEGNVISLEIQ
jgi:hypothetical protein